MTLAAKRPRAKQPKRKTAHPDAGLLLAWYDRHRRQLPWRAAAGERCDPYRVWLSEIMLQQTTVKAVAPYFVRFVTRWPNVHALAAAPLDDVLKLWAGLGYYARARNLHACAKMVVDRHGGIIPPAEDELAGLPGIGAYTAAAIAAIAFDVRTAAVDGNVERVVTRLFAVNEPLPGAKPRVRALAEALVPDRRAGDFAQALMELGATICTPKKPACALCPWTDGCRARRRGDPEKFPVKVAKKEGRLRRGAAFVVLRADNRVLVRARAPNGLLGGMTEVPTTAWTHDFDESTALASAPRLARLRPQWRHAGTVAHVFTHFPLELAVYTARVPAGAAAPQGSRWVSVGDLAGEALPSVMRKVVAKAFDQAAANRGGREGRLARAHLRPDLRA